MKYTAVFIDFAKRGYTTEYFVTHHDKDRAWIDIMNQTDSTKKLMFLIPGEQTVYSEHDISLTFGS
jgi:hypothetical protein